MGHDADGRPYYAMRFIHGATLGEEVEHLYKDRAGRDEAAWNVEFRRLLRSFVSVCQTVAYAHVRGVIHRDIKPANVMLGPYGETLVVDWGLAKRYDLADPEETADTGHEPVVLTAEPAGQTVHGKAKGSPAYMAPEQARGEWDRVGPRSDVYSLGATLYVLLTGLKPYAGKSSDEVITAVKAGLLQRPRAHRSDVPRALEAVCLKAMAAGPEDRYATAKDLADDVDRWLAGEPVTAYPEPLAVRARRWTKRHRTAVSAGVAAVFVAAVLLTVLGAALGAKNQELTQANGSLDRANQDLKQTNDTLESTVAKLTAAEKARQADFEEADAALRGIMDNVFARRNAGRDARMNELRADTLRGYRTYLATFIERNRDRPEMALEVALAHLKTAEAHAVAYEHEKAMAAYERAAAAFEGLHNRRPDDRDVQFGWACAMGQWGDALNDQGQFTKAKPLLTRARDLLERLSADPAPVRLTRYSSDSSGRFVDSPAIRLADVVLALGPQVHLEELAQPPQTASARLPTKRHCELVRRARRALTGDRPVTPGLPYVVQHRAVQLTITLADADPAAVPPGELTDCLATLTRLLTLYPAIAELRDDIAAAEFCLAQRAFTDGRFTQIDGHVKNALAQLQLLDQADLGLDPKRLRDKGHVVRAHIAYAQAVAAAERNDEAQFVKSMGVARENLLKFAAVPDPRLDHVVSAVMLYNQHAGQASLERQTRPEAEACFLEAIQLLDKVRLPAEDDLINSVKLILYGGAAGMRAAQGKPCGDLVAKGEELLRRLGPTAPADILLIGRANLHNARGMEAVLLRRDHAAGLREYEASLTMVAAALKEKPDDQVLQFLASTAEFMVAVTLASAAEDRLDTRPDGDAEALAMVQRSQALMKKQQTPVPVTDPDFRRVVEHMAKPRAAVGPMLSKLEAKALGKALWSVVGGVGVPMQKR
jgi:tetratricopeptide (TPR) repeat protein